MYETIDYSVLDKVATIALNRPDDNAFNKKMSVELKSAFKKQKDDNVRVIVFKRRKPFALAKT